MCQRYDAEVNMGSREQKGDWMPLLFVLTDGKPSDIQAYNEAIQRVKKHQFTNIVACAAGPKAKTEPLKNSQTMCLLLILWIAAHSKVFQWVTINVQQGGRTMGVTDQVELPAPPAEVNLVI